MRSEITRGAGAISMSEVRTRAGRSGAISFSQMYACEGFTANPTALSTKFTQYEGWQYRFNAHGSVSPNEASGVQVAANSYIYGMGVSTPTACTTWSNAYINLADAATGFNAGITAGWRGTDIIRVVTANVSRTLGWAAATNSSAYYTYNWPTTGTIHCMVQF
jgi:hypothetical protein